MFEAVVDVLEPLLAESTRCQLLGKIILCPLPKLSDSDYLELCQSRRPLGRFEAAQLVQTAGIHLC